MEALSIPALLILRNTKLCDSAWTPKDPRHPAILELISKGLFKRVDARCGFEILKDEMIKPTEFGLQIHKLIA